MLSDYIIPGDKIELARARGQVAKRSDGSDEPKKAYKSRLYDIRSEDEIEIDMPMEKGHLELLTVGAEYDLCFYAKKGLYQCYARVKDRYKSNNIYICVLELTSALRKFQRREYYRFSCILDMQCRKLSEEEKKQITESVEFLDTDLTLEDGVIVDISGGGARFVSEMNFEQNTLILFKFSLGNGKENTHKYSIIGRVVLSNPLEGNKGKYENRIQFVNIENREREGIIKYIFEEQRKIRKKENEV